MTRNATQAEADAFKYFMMAHFKGLMVPDIALSALFKATIGLDPTAMLTASAITLGPIVWMRSGFSPDEQMTIAVHECDHLEEWWKNPVDVSWLYLSEDEFRAAHESRAYLAGLEFAYARTKQLPPTLDALVEPMRHGYMLGEGAIQLAKDRLEQGATQVANGQVVTNAARVGIDYLKNNLPDLLAL